MQDKGEDGLSSSNYEPSHHHATIKSASRVFSDVWRIEKIRDKRGPGAVEVREKGI